MRPVTDLERRVAPFKVIADYQPAGDQPAAIKEITNRVQAGLQDVVLLARFADSWAEDRPALMSTVFEGPPV